MKHCRWPLRLLVVPLLLASGAGCVAVIGCGDVSASPEHGQIGAGGSITITVDDGPPFEMHVSHHDVTLLVEGRTVILPHHRGEKGVKFEGFYYEDGEISLDLGRGIDAEIDDLHLEVDGHVYALNELGTYRIGPDGAFSFEPY